MGDKIDITDLVENGKNSKQICCIRCKSKILPPQMGTYEVGSVFHVHLCGEERTFKENDPYTPPPHTTKALFIYETSFLMHNYVAGCLSHLA